MQKERLSERRFGLLPGCAHAFCLVRACLLSPYDNPILPSTRSHGGNHVGVDAGR